MWSNEIARKARRQNQLRELSAVAPPREPSRLAHGGRTEPPRLREPKAVDASAWRWFAVRVAQGTAFRVADELDAIGFETFAPAGRKIVLRGRAAGGKRKRAVREFPVFGNYVFVGASARVVVVKGTHLKIEEVLGDSSGPLAIRADVIANLSRLDRAGFWGSGTTLAARAFVRGDRVTIGEGPFVGFEGVVRRLPGRLKAVVEIALFGTATPVEVDSCILARA